MIKLLIFFLLSSPLFADFTAEQARLTAKRVPETKLDGVYNAIRGAAEHGRYSLPNWGVWDINDEQADDMVKNLKNNGYEASVKKQVGEPINIYFFSVKW